MNITLESITEQAQSQTNVRHPSRSKVTDFFDARHRLVVRNRGTVPADEMLQESQQPEHRCQPAGGSPQIVEQALYWFISAPALVYLVYLICSR